MILKSLIYVLSNWQISPINAIALFLDGIVYSLVAYAYRLFEIMSQLNLNLIYQLASPIVDRVKALVMVFVFFKIAISLITYLLNPDSITKSSSSLLKNIVIAFVLLVSYDFIFDLGNDISMLILGTTNSESYQIIEAPETDEGLLSRFIFGSNNEMDSNSFGVYLSVATLNIFLHDINSSGVASSLYNDILSTGYDGANFSSISVLSSEIDNTVEYTWPLLSTVMGLYLIYTIVTIAIQIGIRMFELLVLQIVAPIAICGIIQDGVKGNFSKFLKTYSSTLFSAIIRIATMYLATAFIGTFYNLIMSGNFTGIDGEMNITNFLVLIILIVATYQFVSQFPKFLQKIFPNLDISTGGNFGNFLNTVGHVAMGAGGLVVGAATGTAAGGLVGGVTGAFRGAASGYRGEGIRGQLQNVERAAQTREQINDAGGLGNYLRNTVGAPLGTTARRQSNARAEIKNAQNTIDREQKVIDKLNEAETKARNELSSSTANYGTFGDLTNVSSAEDLFDRVSSSDYLVNENRRIMNDKSSTDSEKIAAANTLKTRLENLREDTATWYNYAMDNTTAITSSGLGDNATRNAARTTAQSNITSAETQKKAAEQRLKNAGGSSGS